MGVLERSVRFTGAADEWQSIGSDRDVDLSRTVPMAIHSMAFFYRKTNLSLRMVDHLPISV